ncbi:phycobilisome rod-core linker polypeptide [Altericista sp. CCNU0014]|uniref:phycobilisome rod-core linker polypeptide n=1 Tax=Altericista sp. CCNU0014 TaxID=3082949 RepID=UPI00384B229A
MGIPRLEYKPKSQNERVAGYESGGDEAPRIYSTDNLLSPGDMGTLIEAAYRQLYFHAFASDREPYLESQLRNGQISVREFIRGLALSDTYKRSFYDLNSNYRFVEQSVQRILGRDVYSEREKIAWSIVVATKGIRGFIDELLGSEEYQENFGDSIVPYQRRRILPGRSIGETPFNLKSPRYDSYHRSKLGFPQIVWQSTVKSYRAPDRQPRTGDPSLFLSMAQSIRPTGNLPQSVSPYNIDIERTVPYRKR